MIIQDAIEVLKIEADAILKLIDRINGNFTEMVEIIYNSNGRVIIGGIGKSGIIGQKIVATLNSTGSRSIFLHPVEAMHGDLGIVCKDDIFLALSNSGETDEINMLVPAIRDIGCTIIAFTGNINSTLAKNSDIIIDVGVDKEACPLGLAPTASTTAVLAMGDALAVALINKRNFRSSDFKKFHPGGMLGQRLSSKVSEIMLSEVSVPWVPIDASLEDAIEIALEQSYEMKSLRLTLIEAEENRLAANYRFRTNADLSFDSPSWTEDMREVPVPNDLSDDTPTRPYR